MEFSAYLKINNETVYSFSKKTGIAFGTIQKLAEGGNVRKDIAKKIVRATRKLVTMEDLGY